MSMRVRSWLWPVIIASFALCVFFKLNGSSIGIWTETLNDLTKPKGLLLFTPRPSRADEWHGWTPAALSQARQTPPFPIENLSLGGARAPLIMSVPVRHYTAFFRPHLWGFFVFDFERGFSFFWCFKILALLLASAWFLRQLGVRHRGLVLFGTLWIFFSGFIQWWFSSPAMLPEMLATWMICTGCAIRFFKETNRWRLAATFAAFAFAGVDFALCLYPPFQISLLFLMIAVLVGTCLELRNADAPCWTKRGILLTGLGIVTVLLLLIPFWIDVRSTLELVAHTDYPGARRSHGGDLSVFKLFSGLAGFFQTEATIPKVYDNICEASNFYPLWPAVLVSVLVARSRQISAVPPLVIALTTVIVGLSIYCLVPLPQWLLRATFLSFATERRTLLALGLANILLCILFLDRYRDQIFSKWSAIVFGLIFWLVIVALFWSASRSTPGFFPEYRQVVIALIANGVILLFFWETKRRAFMSVLAALLILSNGGTNPVMQGLAPLIGSEAFHEVDKVRAADPTAKWLVYHDFVLAQLVIATGAPILNGNKIVPDFTFLRRLDPEGGGKPIYNRYAYVAAELPDESHGPGVKLYQHDCYILYISPDAPVLSEFNCRSLLFSVPWPDAESRGFSLVKQIMPANLWIYRRRETESR